jgi:tetratricopeptide (TPR) repeat protein
VSSSETDPRRSLENPIIRRAYVMLGPQPLETLRESLLADRELQSKTDEELIRIIEEADRDWRDQYETCVRKPGAIELYAPLMSACCKQRYDSLHKLRDVAPEEEKARLTARMGRLLTVQGHCMLAGAESLLLNEKFRQAYEEFAKSEWMARALPDEGSLRLYEIMWARYGQWVTAMVAGRQNETRSAHAGVGQLLQELGPPAEACLQRVEEHFSPFQWIFQERARLRHEYAEGRLAPAAPEEEPTDAGALLDLLTPLASSVRSGQMTMDAARARVREEFPRLKIPPSMVGTAAEVFELMKAKDLEQAIILLDLNSELALQFPDQLELQEVCLGTLGFALHNLALAKGTGFERALATFERAYKLISAKPELDRRASTICLGLAVCSKGVLTKKIDVLKWSSEAVERLERSTTAPYDRTALMALGNAYGLRGEGRELAGDAKLAMEDHFRALNYFREAGSGLDVRKAYHHIADLCMRTNQLDQAVAACDELLAGAEQVGDVSDVAPTTLDLAMALVRVGRLVPAVQLLDRADRLVLKALENQPHDPKLLEYHFSFRIWAARFYGALLRKAPLQEEERQGMAKDSEDMIEGARQVALELQRDDLLSAAWLELAMLKRTMGDLETARSLTRMVDHIPGCPPQLHAFSYLLEGEIAASQKQFQEALACLDQGLQLAGDDWDDIRVRFIDIRAAVKEQTGDRSGAIADYEDAVKRAAGFRSLLAEESRVAAFELAEEPLDRLFILNAQASPLQDTKRALYWAEYSKSRALAELLGQSGLVLSAPTSEDAALCREEQELLAAVHAQRVTSLSEAAQISVEQSHAMQSRKSRLNEIWDKLASRYPDYVELRRGAVPSWAEIVKITQEQ